MSSVSPTNQDLSNDTTFSQIKSCVPVPLNIKTDLSFKPFIHMRVCTPSVFLLCVHPNKWRFYAKVKSYLPPTKFFECLITQPKYPVTVINIYWSEKFFFTPINKFYPIAHRHTWHSLDIWKIKPPVFNRTQFWISEFLNNRNTILGTI